MQLVPYANNGLELVIDNETGEVYYPGYNALARVVSIGLVKPITAEQAKRSVESASKGITNTTLLETEIQTPGGIQGITLIPRKLGIPAIKKYNPDLYEEMAEAGHVVFLHKLAGYQVTSTAVQPKELTKLEILELALESEKRLLAAQEHIEALKEKVDELAQYGSIIRAAKHNSVDETIFNWRVLKKASINNGWVVKRVPCPRYKWKNLYDVRAFQSCYPEMDFEFDCDEVS